MSKKNKSELPFPEMDNLLAGMEDLLRDENGHPLTPDHPQYQKLSALMESMVNTINTDNMDKLENQTEGPTGQA